VVAILVRNGLEAVRIEVQSSVTPDQTRANNQEERRTDIVLFPSK